jgi:hypothetical protein
MDIILTGPQGCGKSRSTEFILNGMRIHANDVVTLDMTTSMAHLASRFRSHRARAIVIEGIDTIEQLEKAQQVVESYRQSIKGAVIGIYTSQNPITQLQRTAAILEATKPLRDVGNYEAFKATPPINRSAAALVRIWNVASDTVSPQGAQQMLDMAEQLVPGCVTRPTEDFIALLSMSQRITLHQFLTDLISEHEN